MSLEINPITDKTVEYLAELLSEYQSFYKAKQSYDHNLKFLEGFLKREDGIFFIGSDGLQNIGYVSLYFSYSSVSAKRVAILNDLYVRENFRNHGIGKRLIDYAINYAKDIGISQIRWCTRIDNNQAQGLYAKYGAVKTDWFHYDLDIEGT